jgi:hypothetical protein
MRAQRVSYPSFDAPVHQALKLAPNLNVPDFRKQAMEQKLRFQELADFAQSELRQFGSGIAEVFCASFQI